METISRIMGEAEMEKSKAETMDTEEENFTTVTEGTVTKVNMTKETIQM